MLEKQNAYMLQNQLNPFPVAGDLVLDGNKLRFTLNEKSAGASLGWLEKALGMEGLKERVQAGERPVVFNLDVAGRKITWPRSLAKIGMKIEDGERNWLVSLDQPNSGALFQVLSLFEGGKRSQPWRDALAEAGAT